MATEPNTKGARQVLPYTHVPCLRDCAKSPGNTTRSSGWIVQGQPTKRMRLKRFLEYHPLPWVVFPEFSHSLVTRFYARKPDAHPNRRVTTVRLRSSLRDLCLCVKDSRHSPHWRARYHVRLTAQLIVDPANRTPNDSVQVRRRLLSLFGDLTQPEHLRFCWRRNRRRNRSAQ